MSAPHALVAFAMCAALGCSEVAGVRSLHLLADTASLDAGADAQCTNVASDGANCGTCGHSCLGGACHGGECAPVTLATVPDTGAVTLAVDGTNVYAAVTDDQVLAVPVTGGDLVTVAVPSSLRSIAADARDLFLGTATSLLLCAGKSCGLPKDIADPADPPVGVATAGDDVYFLDKTALLHTTRAGAPLVTIAAPRPAAFIATAQGIVFSRADGIYVCAAGCSIAAPPRIADATSASSIALEGGDVLWIDGAAIRSAAFSVPPVPTQGSTLAAVDPSAGSLVATKKPHFLARIPAGASRRARAGEARRRRSRPAPTRPSGISRPTRPRWFGSPPTAAS